MQIEEFKTLRGYKRNQEQERKLQQIGRLSFITFPVTMDTCEKFPDAKKYRHTGRRTEESRRHLERLQYGIRAFYGEDGQIVSFQAMFGSMLAITCSDLNKFEQIKKILLEGEQA